MPRKAMAELDWHQRWDKTYESALKDVRKLREELNDPPKFSPIAMQKYRLYIDVLAAEVRELKEAYAQLEKQEENHKDKKNSVQVSYANGTAHP